MAATTGGGRRGKSWPLYIESLGSGIRVSGNAEREREDDDEGVGQQE